MDPVRLGGRRLSRVGLSVSELRGTGMWGEPVDLAPAVATVRRAVEMGVDIVEVPVPFGPYADVVRQAGLPDAFVVVRLTGPVTDLDVVRKRLGRPPDLVLADPARLDHIIGWPVRLGALAGPGPGPATRQLGLDHPIEAVRGPYPASPPVLEWCEEQAIPYLAPSAAILGAGRHTVALLAPRSPTEVERLFDQAAATPPAAEPG
jgi:hypothetical protein